MLQSTFIFSDRVPKCYIHMTLIRGAKIGDEEKILRGAHDICHR